jgi:hypothetical protein
MDFGMPRTVPMKIIANIFNLFEPLSDNINGLIPHILSCAGFKESKEERFYNTTIGSLSLYSAIK